MTKPKFFPVISKMKAAINPMETFQIQILIKINKTLMKLLPSKRAEIQKDTAKKLIQWGQLLLQLSKFSDLSMLSKEKESQAPTSTATHLPETHTLELAGLAKNSMRKRTDPLQDTFKKSEGSHLHQDTFKNTEGRDLLLEQLRPPTTIDLQSTCLPHMDSHQGQSWLKIELLTFKLLSHTAFMSNIEKPESRESMLNTKKFRTSTPSPTKSLKWVLALEIELSTDTEPKLSLINS